MRCRICAESSAPFATATVRQKYPVGYYRCPRCGLVQTEDPYWLEEAYAVPINVCDTGLLARNLRNAAVAAAVLRLCLDPDTPCLDHGGGYGILVRLMRDRGFDFYRDDRYCDNLFAQGFDLADSPAGRFGLITAFELLEHLASPVEEVKLLLEKSDSVLFSTETLPVDPPPPPGWWYYGAEHGQHITFYTERSLRMLAQAQGVEYYRAGNMHLFTREKRRFMAARFRLAAHRAGELLLAISRRGSLTFSDARRLTPRPKGNTGC